MCRASSTTSNQSSTGSSLHRSVILYYLKPEFHRLLSAQVSHHQLTQTRVPKAPLCTGQSSSITSNQSSTGSSLHRSVILYYLKPEFHRPLSAPVSHHLLPETVTHLYTDWSSSTQIRVPQVLFCKGQWGGAQKSTLSPQILGTIGSSMIAKSLFKWCKGVITLH